MKPEHVRHYNLGLLYTELNTILARIRRRRIGEPTARERARIQELQTAIREIRSREAHD